MASVRKLIDNYGVGVKVQAPRHSPFTVIEDKGQWVRVKYDNGTVCEILSDYSSCNDYERVQHGY